MLSVNRRISHDASRDDTTWLGRLDLNVEEVSNWLISDGKEVLTEVTCSLSEEGHVRTMSKKMKKKMLLIKK